MSSLNTFLKSQRLRRSAFLQRHHTGFTVVEMLVVLALSAILMVSLMGVVNIFVRYQTLFQDKYPDVAWKNRIEAQFREDVINSREYKANVESLELVGYAAKDFVNGAATMRASSIRYSIEEVSGIPWLVREESHRNNRNRVVSSRELVCAGIQGIQFERLETATALDLGDLKSQPEMQVFARLTDRILVCLFEDAGRSQLAQTSDRLDRERTVQPWIFQIFQR